MPGTLHTDLDRLAEEREERARMGRVSGGLWVVGGVVGILGALLPGASHEGVGWVVALGVLVLAYGLGSVTGLIPWGRASLRALALGMVFTVPVVGVGLYITGASISYIEPLLVCSLLYAAFFFPERWAWPLTAELLLVAATPLLYDERAREHAYLPRFLTLAAAFLAVTWVTTRVKRRLVEAERDQREMANLDPLTGVANRRAFDSAVRRELAALAPAAEWDAPDDRFALMLLDLDDFKSINDVHGHLIGDAVLRDVARRAGRVIRSGDTLARIGGDEFAVVAPGCDPAGAAALASRLSESVAARGVAPAVPAPRVTVGWSVFPEDGETPTALMRAADERLLALKRGEPAPDPEPSAGERRLRPVA